MTLLLKFTRDSTTAFICSFHQFLMYSWISYSWALIILVGFPRLGKNLNLKFTRNSISSLGRTCLWTLFGSFSVCAPQYVICLKFTRDSRSSLGTTCVWTIAYGSFYDVAFFNGNFVFSFGKKLSFPTSNQMFGSKT